VLFGVSLSCDTISCMDIKRAYKYRFYPTAEQEVMLARTFGCARFVYNHMLQVRSEAWKNRQERIGYAQTSAQLTALKKDPEHDWLNEVSSVPVQQALRHLETAFKNFFAKRAGHPVYKSKRGRQAAEYTTSGFRWDGKMLKLAKMSAPLNIRWSRAIPKAAKITTVTVSKDPAGRYFVSLLCDDAVAAKSPVNGQVGIDLGLTFLNTLSTGEKIEGVKAFWKHKAHLAKLQRQLRKKQKGSKRKEKLRVRIARLHARIADIRRDFLHKLSTRLIHENQVIAVESLSVKALQKEPWIARLLADAAWYEFFRQLEYKAKWYGRTLIRIDRDVPSSRMCSVCGHVLDELPLSVRAWTCPGCSAHHDRDINAARNILAAGLAASARGEAVSPVCA